MPKPLYRLHTSHPATRPVLLASAVLLFLLMGMGQAVASRLHYSAHLGPPWLAGLGLSDRAFALAVLLLVLLGSGLLAYAKSYRQRYLGPLLLLLSLAPLLRGPLYPPFALWLWARHFPSVLSIRPWLALANLLVGLHLTATVLAFLLLRKPKPDLHGSARWATTADLADLDLLPAKPPSGTVVGPPGQFIGLWPSSRRPRPLHLKGPNHVLLTGPTRSGKGVGYVLPYLLTTTDSVIVLDIKSELWGLTAGARQSLLGQRVLRFDPTSFETARYNPLLAVRPHPYDVQDARAIADLLVDPNGDKTADHWDRTSHALLTGLILHCLYAETNKTLDRCAGLLSEPNRPIEQVYRTIQATHHLPSGPHPVVASVMQENLDRASEEASGVKSTALSFLSVYRDPLVANATSALDFTPEEFFSTPTSLYLTLPPNQLAPLRPLLRLFLNQLCRSLTNHSQVHTPSICLVIDEFPALGTLPFFQESMGFLAGYGVRVFLVAQDLAQIENAYGRGGKREAITGNCTAHIYLTPRNIETARRISDSIGRATIHHRRSTSRDGRGLLSFDRSLADAETQRPLLLPDEVMRLPKEDAIVLLPGVPPLRTQRLYYADDPELLRRSQIPAPPFARLERPPSHPWHSVAGPADLSEATPPSYRRLPRKMPRPT